MTPKLQSLTHINQVADFTDLTQTTSDQRNLMKFMLIKNRKYKVAAEVDSYERYLTEVSKMVQQKIN
jgi:hypothetical protein